jgi:hypothetical protein
MWSTMRDDTDATAAQTVQANPESRPVVCVLIPVWGYKYIELFCEVGLPALLAPGNLPFLSQETDCVVTFLTTKSGVRHYENNPAFRKLQKICKTSFVYIDDLVGFRNYGVTLTLAYARGIKSLGDRQRGAYFIFLNADFVLSGNSFSTVLRYMRRGFNVVLAPSLRCNEEEVFGLLARKVDPDRCVLDLPPRPLVQIALEHLHPTVVASIINRNVYHHSAANQFFWQIDDQTLIGRFFLLFMLCIRVEDPLIQPSGFCDYTFVPDLCPSGNFAVIKDSDEAFLLELQARLGEIQDLGPGSLKPTQYSKRLSRWTTREHRAYAAETIVFHAGDLTSEASESRQQADAFMTELTSSLKKEPVSHRDHPFWISALRTVSRDVGVLPENIKIPKRRRFSLSSYDFVVLYDAVIGRPPFVGPLHPQWLDYRALRQALRRVAASARNGLYLRGNDNPVDRLAARLQFIRHVATFGEAIDGQMLPQEDAAPFDFCLLCCSDCSVDMAWSVLARIAPRLAPDADVIIYSTGREGALLPNFIAALPQPLSVEHIKKITYVRGAYRIHLGLVMSHIARQLFRRGLLNIPWDIVRVGYACAVTGMINLAAVLHPRQTGEFCTSIIVELSGGWTDRSWKTLASQTVREQNSSSQRASSSNKQP